LTKAELILMMTRFKVSILDTVNAELPAGVNGNWKNIQYTCATLNRRQHCSRTFGETTYTALTGSGTAALCELAKYSSKVVGRCVSQLTLLVGREEGRPILFAGADKSDGGHLVSWPGI
jgi:hypothetical protein